MSKLLAVFGATGTQGGSVIDHVLNDSELSHKYQLRAITRDINSEKVKHFKGKVEVVRGDVLNRPSLETALTGVHTVFIMTTPSFGPNALDTEYYRGKTIADVAVSKGVEYIIFSTLPSVKELSGGKYTKVTAFDAKAKIEQYIRSLPIRSAFFSAGSFMQNYQSQTFLSPYQESDGTWVLARNNRPETRWPLIDAVGDTGKFVGAILAEPEKYEDETLYAATTLYSMDEVAAAISKGTGKTIVYKQISSEDLKKTLPFDSDTADIFVEGFSCIEEFGYFGPDSEGLVAWAAGNARGRLSTLEEYFEAHPLRLT